MRAKREIIKLIENGKHFCIYPWIHLHIESWGGMTPCCLSSQDIGNLNENSFNELWQGEAMRNFRLKMLQDEKNENCQICYKIEEAGGFSQRKHCNALFSRHIDWVTNTDDYGYAPDSKPVSWDIRFSNICNLKCRTCYYQNSSSWYQDYKDMGSIKPVKGVCNNGHIIDLADPDSLAKELHQYFPYLESLYCAGGEPLLMKENLQLLRELEAIGKYDVKLSYNINLTQIDKADKFFDYWAKMKDITILVSLDGSNKRGEYIRKGIVWESIIQNLILLKQKLPQANIKVNYTVSALNILHLPDFHKEMVEKGYLAADQIVLNMLHIPELLNTTILPEDIKKSAELRILEHISWLKQQVPFCNTGCSNHLDYQNQTRQWHACIRHMNSEDSSHLIPVFLDYTRKLDELRNENCLQVFPELEPIFRIR